jgi:hypothetical protein
MKTVLKIIFILTLFYSCDSSEMNRNNNDKREESVAANMEFYSPAPPGSSSSFKFEADDATSFKYDKVTNPDVQISNDRDSGDKKIIKDGSISIKATDILSSKQYVDSLTKQFNGYYESEDLQNIDRSITYTLKIRVPSDKFEKLIAAIESGKDEIQSKSIQARDVTEEFVDLKTRLENKREFHKRYKELLLRANTVKDILSIEENIRVIQEEIESSEGRLRYLNDQVTYSTLEISLVKVKEFVYKPEKRDSFIERIKKSLGSGWNSIVDFVIIVIGLWPFILLMSTLVYIIRRLKKHKKLK